MSANRAKRPTGKRRGPTPRQRRSIRFPETITDKRTKTERASIERATGSDCELCTAAVNSSGYPQIKGEPAHRVMYREKKGPIPKGYDVHHACGVKRCVRQGHLFALSPADHRDVHRLLREVRRLFDKE